jgi:hypothetical protein
LAATPAIAVQGRLRKGRVEGSKLSVVKPGALPGGTSVKLGSGLGVKVIEVDGAALELGNEGTGAWAEWRGKGWAGSEDRAWG